jgi:uncharacterized membrane protein
MRDNRDTDYEKLDVIYIVYVVAVILSGLWGFIFAKYHMSYTAFDQFVDGLAVMIGSLIIGMVAFFISLFFADRHLRKGKKKSEGTI